MILSKARYIISRKRYIIDGANYYDKIQVEAMAMQENKLVDLSFEFAKII